MAFTYPYPSLSEAALAGRYIANVLRKAEEPDRQIFVHACYVVEGALLNLGFGENVVSTQNVVPIESEEQVLKVLENLEDADDSAPGHVRAMGLIGDAGRRVILGIIQKLLKDVLAGVNWDELLKKILGGVLPTTP